MTGVVRCARLPHSLLFKFIPRFAQIFVQRRGSIALDSCHTAGMVVARTLPDLDQLDAEALKTLLRATHEQLISHQDEIEHLKLLIAKLRRMQFGRKSEKLQLQIEQLELKLEELETAKAQRDRTASPASQDSQRSASQKPTRKALPEHLPREVKTYAPKTDACPECGGHLRKLGEDVSEVLEYVPARFV